MPNALWARPRGRCVREVSLARSDCQNESDGRWDPWPGRGVSPGRARSSEDFTMTSDYSGARGEEGRPRDCGDPRAGAEDSRAAAAILTAARRGDVRAVAAARSERQVILALQAAVGLRDQAAIRLMVAAGADLNAGERSAALVPLAAANRDIETLTFLVRAGADVNARKERSRWSALMVAVENEDLRVVRALVALGASPTASAPDGTTAVTIADRKTNRRVRRALLRALHRKE